MTVADFLCIYWPGNRPQGAWHGLRYRPRRNQLNMKRADEHLWLVRLAAPSNQLSLHDRTAILLHRLTNTYGADANRPISWLPRQS